MHNLSGTPIKNFQGLHNFPAPATNQDFTHFPLNRQAAIFVVKNGGVPYPIDPKGIQHGRAYPFWNTGMNGRIAGVNQFFPIGTQQHDELGGIPAITRQVFDRKIAVNFYKKTTVTIANNHLILDFEVKYAAAIVGKNGLARVILVIRILPGGGYIEDAVDVKTQPFGGF